MEIGNRTLQGQNCPICSNNRTITGVNDLETKFPEISQQADGWDPSTINPGSNRKKDWKCHLGHKWKATVDERTRGGTGCPVCTNRLVLKGFNDLLTTHPHIAKSAKDWDPSTVTSGSSSKYMWECSLAHTWITTVADRVRGRDCPICANRILLVGFNDLLSQYPEIAAEADGWDPSQVLYGSAEDKDWLCSQGHKWSAKIVSRVGSGDKGGTGCPSCAKSGFDPNKEAYLYLMSRPGEQQFGISNVIKQRLRTHEGNGWTLIDLIGPASGHDVLRAERDLKRWLKDTHGTVEGTSENWSTASMEVFSLAELKLRSNISTNLF